MEIWPFLNSRQFSELYRPGGFAAKAFSIVPSLAKRIANTFQLSGFDLLLVQREAMFFGPAIFEWLYQNIGQMPMVLDLDDVTYIRYDSPNFGRLANYLKFFGKTDKLIARSAEVICGNRYIAEHVEKQGRLATVIPTISDPQKFVNRPPPGPVPIIGWIGTNSTYPFLKRLFPVLRRLAHEHDFELRIIGSGRNTGGPEQTRTTFVNWELNRETADLQSFDIGVYPIFNEGSVDENWLAGKSGFKAVQYLSAGTPFVMSPVGVCDEIGIHGQTHFNASTDEDWYDCLEKLLVDVELRVQMGQAGRQYALMHYSLETHTEKLVEVLLSAAEAR